MTDPAKQLREQLDQLIKNSYFYIGGLTDQLERIKKWSTPERKGALNLSRYFFDQVVYTFSRTVLVEICKLLAPKKEGKDQERSLVVWLHQAHTHAKLIQPTRYDPEYSKGERRPVTVKEYKSIIDGQLASIDQNAKLIANIKSRRDKSIAHADPKYFGKHQKLLKDFPLDGIAIDELLDLIGQILRDHHSMLFGVDLASIRVSSAHHVDVVLRYARAFQRARRDVELIKMGFRPVDYSRDDQDDKDNPLW